MERLLEFRKFFPSNIVAFVSDRTINFARRDNRLSLSLRQKKYLSRAAGVKITLLPNIKQVHGRRINVVMKSERSLRNSFPKRLFSKAGNFSLIWHSPIKGSSSKPAYLPREFLIQKSVRFAIND